MQNSKLKKKIAIIIAFQDFRDEEYFITKSVFETAGFEIKTISTRQGKALGIFGGVVDIDLSIEEVKAQDFEAVVFAGGAGMAKNLDNEKMQKLAKDVFAQNKVLAAICIAPILLAKAGVLNGKKATVWQSPMDKSAVKILNQEGAQVVDEPIVVDGNIITADGPQSARKFGEAIAKALDTV